MAYNNYFPATYQSPVQYQPQSSGLIWVQGEAAARSYMVGAGQSVLLMDSDASCFYIKTADQSGMPLPLRIFDYKEREHKGMPEAEKAEFEANTSLDGYVTHEELDEKLKELAESLKPKKGKKNESDL